ncbi:phenylpyruvate tautomerase PptA (4-oxalocrotonate tautomerase family) [Mycolicibacterium sp. BK556]|uniref:tautomerase family protein n=1 Tax=unclassified Mycolicibacterium TaxID=2636767 RepID=UPI00160BF727|nr:MULTISPECIES: tautomerase family protein [unclassified Mycolicibacterium]MBB3606093.1 phenylpyruvate tautomerase PptA (4-oxalocrotonate tautomerase family) [Mycolicibacterium sp. BK556]MBB3632670.1 phenylpyruvate tautomerase PptA (4-oxalocrotonate tautomerase family) [Mycolicibacterium sp. BK607]MBB3754019.1 phenylpyruvate tautomerase PptA (4-oxalocrotonate tautomerase family) [Mycolicibacterium sp. BK634]
MPIYTCTTTQSTIDTDTKAALAREITRIHSVINHVPSTYVNVVFHELPVDCVYTDAVPARPLLITGWVRDGHPEAETTRLAMEIAAAASRVTLIPAQRVLVVFESSPAHYAVEGGRVLPEPGEEAAWLAAGAH